MSEIKVNKITPRTDCGTTQLGDSGDTITIPAGATITNSGTANGFGATGAVNWQTTPKTGTFTATAGEGYFCNTTGGSFEVDLPAGSAGDIIAVQDYNNTFDTYSLTVDPNGTEKINGGDAGAAITLSTEGLGITFVYIDSTVGWRSVDSNEYSTAGQTPAFIVASGGNSCGTSGNFKWHKFTGPGSLTVSCVGNPAGSDTVSYLVVAGGGGGAGTNSPPGSPYSSGGGGGAGGLREGLGSNDSYTGTPIRAATGIPVSPGSYPIVVGGGGTGGPGTGNGGKGNDSSFGPITSTGGGFGSYRESPTTAGPGGSGGGGGGGATGAGAGHASCGGNGNDPATSPAQGTNGGNGSCGSFPAVGAAGGGGGGATAVGGVGAVPGGGDGGAGGTSCISATPTAYGGGGGGGVYVCGPVGSGGSGDGGAGGGGPGGPGPASTSPGGGQCGTCNTGGGGGGGSTQGPDSTARGGGAGGSGIVIVRYKYQ